MAPITVPVWLFPVAGILVTMWLCKQSLNIWSLWAHHGHLAMALLAGLWTVLALVGFVATAAATVRAVLLGP